MSLNYYLYESLINLVLMFISIFLCIIFQKFFNTETTRSQLNVICKQISAEF